MGAHVPDRPYFSSFFLGGDIREFEWFFLLGEPKLAAAAVMREAYNRRSGDNLTCVVVMFGWNLNRAEQVF